LCVAKQPWLKKVGEHNITCSCRRGCRGFLLKKRCSRINLLVASALVVVIENLSGGTHN